MFRGPNLTKASILIFALLFFICFFPGVSSAYDCKWNGSAADNDASNPANWTDCNGVEPQTGDRIEFNTTDVTGSADCTWNISPSTNLASFDIGAGYSGAITLNNDITIKGDISINGGTLDAGTNLRFIYVGGNWIHFNGIDAPLGDIDLSGTVDSADVMQIIDMVKGSPLYYCSDINFDDSVYFQQYISTGPTN